MPRKSSYLSLYWRKEDKWGGYSHLWSSDGRSYSYVSDFQTNVISYYGYDKCW